MTDISSYLQKVSLPDSNSHKGQNGKLLIIGGSNLFHAASKWSLDIASKFVDMVFYSSVPSNNELIQVAKQNFWNGIVVSREHIDEYLQEADCVLIGPGMDRSKETEELTNEVLKKYPDKKWVIDAGALQMVNPELLNEHCVITPHHKEFLELAQRMNIQVNDPVTGEAVVRVSEHLHNAAIIVKGPSDIIVFQNKVEMIAGGNAGMTKGGTGDVLAGLIAGLYTVNDEITAVVVGSYINKKAGENLWQKVGPYFNASDLVNEIPITLWEEMKKAKNSP
jgi:hydroxyethylthiazole kinase-like uncharacterized protein yjeF